ncbi:Hypothetical protein CAP_8049 [Chondromyces apiculatus DSM 436]|uniref:Uncharacterized protein n=1 Tax=Chondromyces apiculatus DSM 436 TaxID=1192034 RepID=A0A017SX11_9BACT|nr:Hypothetical protein CAP_8049 [Chondromyces apiculatus DSM 436]
MMSGCTRPGPPLSARGRRVACTLPRAALHGRHVTIGLLHANHGARVFARKPRHARCGTPPPGHQTGCFPCPEWARATRGHRAGSPRRTGHAGRDEVRRRGGGRGRGRRGRVQVRSLLARRGRSACLRRADPSRASCAACAA